MKSKKKRFSLKFSPIFCPKLGEKHKKRSLLKFPPILSQTWVVQAYRKRTEHTLCVIKPYAQLAKGGPCLNFAYYSMQLYNPGNAHGTTALPPKYNPGFEGWKTSFLLAKLL